MSWDVFIQHLPASALTVDDVPDDFTGWPLGSRPEVLQTVARVFPTVDCTDPSLLRVRAANYALDIAIGSDDPVAMLTVRVRGDAAAVRPIAELIELLGARAIDSWTGEFFDPDAAEESVERWRMYVQD
ncbi:MAG TPA: hypothetical protein VFN10_16625 [Thermoanaerobaculia bacterium]|nr:hypothetical protein [Thermoanaerobaculia bacterium]